MSDPSSSAPMLNPADVADFQEVLRQSKRIVAVLGAGVSASSGLATFRGSNGLWAGQDVMQVATPAGFRHDPGLVWQFYSYRRREAAKAKPNAAHYALAELARRLPGFVTLSQNVDNLSPRAGHPLPQLKQLHGNLFNLRCVDAVNCGYEEHGNLRDHLTPALDPSSAPEAAQLGTVDSAARPKASPLLLAGIARKHATILGDAYRDRKPSSEDLTPLRGAATADADGEQQPRKTSDIRLSSGLTAADLPQCPACRTNILRPAVVWFGEALDPDVAAEAEAHFDEGLGKLDLCLVIGTSSKVWPAAGYAEMARNRGARVAVVNLDATDAAKNVRRGRDWVFVGDAAVLVPELLRPVIGAPETWLERPVSV
ncbi:DHS-like NAD/FAD-binding domain-containing protein [Xylariomycetidae sp. FL2044]|nr:DHS-like NAD/FAD-binding domain-containing protein [Xylariomycetidae sp. FL2044]